MYRQVSQQKAVKRRASLKQSSSKKARIESTAALRGGMLKLLNSQRELKKAVYTKSEFQIQKGIDSALELHKIMPEVPQGTGENQRLGNAIRCMKVVIRGYLRYEGNPADGNHQTATVRNLIFEQLGVDSRQMLDNATVFQFNNLLEPSGPYTGTPIQNITPLNSSAFKTFRDTKHVVTQELATAAGGAVDSQTNGRQNFQEFTCTISFGQYGRKLTYKTSGEDDAENFPYVMGNSQNIAGINALCQNTTGAPAILMGYTSVVDFYDS